MARNNLLYLVIGALVVAAIFLGYQLYESRQPKDGVEIKLGPDGVSVQPK
jgi:hypothetical protein